jgi:hypothetical protein
MSAFTVSEGVRKGSVDEIALHGFGPLTDSIAANVLVGYELTAVVLRPGHLSDVGRFMEAVREAIRTIGYATAEDEWITVQWNIDDDHDEEENLV